MATSQIVWFPPNGHLFLGLENTSLQLDVPFNLRANIKDDEGALIDCDLNCDIIFVSGGNHNIMGSFNFNGSYDGDITITNDISSGNYGFYIRIEHSCNNDKYFGIQSAIYQITWNDEEEKFWIGVTMTSDNQIFELPVRGYGFDGNQNVNYDWIIDYGDGTPDVYASGISSVSGLLASHTYITSGYYEITVKPNSNNPVYGWARAFSCGYNIASNTKPFITNGGKFTWKSLAESETSVGEYFNDSKYTSCGQLNTPEDTSNWSISGIQGNNFNNGKYAYCVQLDTPEDTSNWSISGIQGDNFNNNKYQNCQLNIPENTSNWSISGSQGDNFNNNKYQNCDQLNITEDTSDWSISGRQKNNFNNNKYQFCGQLNTPEDTSNWSISGDQGYSFNNGKYAYCVQLNTPEDTSNWSISGSQGIRFNKNKYYNCNQLTYLEDWSNFEEITSTGDTTENYLCDTMYYLETANTTLTGDTTVMRSKFPNSTTPPYRISTFHNRTGLTDYDTLDPNWK
jgi:hypothetical protein